VNISRLPIRHVEEIDFLNEYSKQIYDALDYGICIVDSYGIVRYVNSSYCECFNEIKSSVINTSVERNRYDDILKKSMVSGENKRGMIQSKGKIYEVEVNPIYSHDEFVGIAALYKKIDKEPLKIHEDYIEQMMENPFPKIIGKNTALIKELKNAEIAAKTNATILIRGESGTGKELLARSIYETSRRSQESWIAINCAAIPENLIESELFGHEEGAFTGASKRKIGKFEMADGGTIFLDEIGDLSLSLQVKLLRVLQEREIWRVGGSEAIGIDTRIIAATHRNLEKMVEEGTFREDLYYRLNMIEIYINPLRERNDDIPELIEYFVDKLSQKHGKEDMIIDDEAKELLCGYQWKGNIREMKNVVERAVILSMDNTISLRSIPEKITGMYRNYDAKSSSLVGLGSDGQIASIEDYEKEIYRMAFEKYKSYNSAGKALGVTHKTVAAKCRKYMID
jgi:transcriptional regulator with PAS, ATPase and Fis domain